SGLRANEARLLEIPTALPPLSDPSRNAGVFLLVGKPAPCDECDARVALTRFELESFETPSGEG
ncbi:hypothetical protein, partial [Vibrio sp. V39_P1S14PM300]|uniref:hypothetical protein n=1 Tax=Vibrio sp. V39_P1S14PM300 TaxID=1938690 RepID=UPI001F2DBE94